MAPVKCILHHMKSTANNRKAIYYFGANRVKELFLVDDMKMFEAQLNDFQFAPVVAAPEEGENWAGQKGLVTDAVQQNLKNAPEYEAYLCGSPGMIDASIKVLLGLGMSEEKILHVPEPKSPCNDCVANARHMDESFGLVWCEHNKFGGLYNAEIAKWNLIGPFDNELEFKRSLYNNFARKLMQKSI